MQNSRNNRRQSWLKGYRITAVIAHVLTLATVVTLLVLSGQPVTYKTNEPSKVQAAATFLQSAGFNDPVYLGIQSGSESEYPTFQVSAIGGKTLKVWIRTTPNGGLEIQPVEMFEPVASADAFAKFAQDAVDKWKNMPPNIKPRTDGAYGEYESRKYDYDHFAKYAPDAGYWNQPRDETRDWPRK